MPRAEAAQRFPFADHGTTVRPHARRFPVGAEVTGGGVHFRVWAPARKTVDVVFDSGDIAPLQRRTRLGIFLGLGCRTRAQGLALQIQARRWRIVSRSGVAIPAGGPAWLSSVVSIRGFSVDRPELARRHPPAQVIYEMHIGTFTQARHLVERAGRAAALGRNRRHRSGTDAGGRVSRPLRLGL